MLLARLRTECANRYILNIKKNIGLRGLHSILCICTRSGKGFMQLGSYTGNSSGGVSFVSGIGKNVVWCKVSRHV